MTFFDDLHFASYRNDTTIFDLYDKDPLRYASSIEEALATPVSETENTLLTNGVACSSSEFLLRFLEIPFTKRIINKKCIIYNKCTPLILCMSKGWTHKDTGGLSQIPLGVIAKKLVEKGADVNLTDKYGRSAFHYACLHRDMEAIQFLIERGASDKSDSSGLKPSDFLSYDFQQASDILTEASGGEHFTLDRDKFDLNITLLVSDLLEKNKSPVTVNNPEENKKINDPILNPLFDHILAWANKYSIDLNNINNFQAEYQNPDNSYDKRAAIYLYKNYQDLINTKEPKERKNIIKDLQRIFDPNTFGETHRILSELMTAVVDMEPSVQIEEKKDIPSIPSNAFTRGRLREIVGRYSSTSTLFSGSDPRSTSMQHLKDLADKGDPSEVISKEQIMKALKHSTHRFNLFKYGTKMNKTKTDAIIVEIRNNFYKK